MRRLAAALAVAAGLSAAPFAGTASACPQPAEGEPTCCQAPELVGVDVAGRHVGVPDPTWKPWLCE